jgi:hypothetical protein
MQMASSERVHTFFLFFFFLFGWGWVGNSLKGLLGLDWQVLKEKTINVSLLFGQILCTDSNNSIFGLVASLFHLF